MNETFDEKDYEKKKKISEQNYKIQLDKYELDYIALKKTLNKEPKNYSLKEDHYAYEYLKAIHKNK